MLERKILRIRPEAANEYYLNSKLTGDYFEEIEFKVNNGKMISGNKNYHLMEKYQ